MTDVTLNKAQAPFNPVLATALYLAVVLGLLAGTVLLFQDLGAKRTEAAAAQERLSQVSSRFRVLAPAPAGGARLPFLDGATITIAGASLQERLTAAVAKAGGTLLSSEVHLDGPEAKDGFVALTASLQMGQPELQAFLYDLEAGMPYLFIDRLSIQSAEQFGEPDTGLLRVTITVTGQWRPSK